MYISKKLKYAIRNIVAVKAKKQNWGKPYILYTTSSQVLGGATCVNVQQFGNIDADETLTVQLARFNSQFKQLTAISPEVIDPSGSTTAAGGIAFRNVIMKTKINYKLHLKNNSSHSAYVDVYVYRCITACINGPATNLLSSWQTLNMDPVQSLVNYPLQDIGSVKDVLKQWVLQDHQSISLSPGDTGEIQPSTRPYFYNHDRIIRRDAGDGLTEAMVYEKGTQVIIYAIRGHICHSSVTGSEISFGAPTVDAILERTLQSNLNKGVCNIRRKVQSTSLTTIAAANALSADGSLPTNKVPTITAF